MSAAARHKPSRTAFICAFAAIYVIWGSTYLGIRVAVETMPPFLMSSARFVIAGGVLMALVQLRGAPTPTRRQWLDNAFIGTCLLLGGNGLVSWAEQALDSGFTALVIGVQPVFMVLTEWAWRGGQRPTSVTFAGLLLGFVGLAWLISPWESSAATGINLPAVALVLFSCTLWCFGSIWSRHVKNPAPAFQASAMQMLCGSVALLAGALIHGDFASLHLAAISQRSFIAFLYLTFVGSLIGFSTFVWLMKYSNPARVSTYAYVNPIVAVFLGWLILNERITPRMLVATFIIIGAVVIITTQKQRHAKSSPASEPLASPQPAIENDSS